MNIYVINSNKPIYWKFIGKIKSNTIINSVENNHVWGEYNAPENKWFEDDDRKKRIKFEKDDNLIIVYNKIEDEDDKEYYECNIKCLYICKYKDIWYYLEYNDAEKFLNKVEKIKEDLPK